MAMQNSEAVFTDCIHKIIKNWQVLVIVNQQGFGGSMMAEKMEWLCDSVVQIFKDNANVYPDEVADFISEVIFNEFDTIADDGSLPKLSLQLCDVYKKCKSGQSEVVFAEVQQMIANTSHIPVVQKSNDQGDASCSEDDEAPELAPASASNGSAAMESDCMSAPEADTSGADAVEYMEEEEGWDVVKRSKKKR